MTYVIKVSLAGIRPPIWRRLEIPGSVTLDRLHDILQVTMGWFDGHLHAFSVGDDEYGDLAQGEDPTDYLDECLYTLSEVLPEEKSKLVYEYDFGDSWDHRITVEKILPATGVEHATCLGGRRACPPEDCGGPWGYQALLAARENPDDPETQELLEWAGDLDPETFDRTTVNHILERL